MSNRHKPTATLADRFGTFDAGAGRVIYDRENSNAWVQSTETVLDLLGPTDTADEPTDS